MHRPIPRWPLAYLALLAVCCLTFVFLRPTPAQAQLYCGPGSDSSPGDPEVLVGTSPTPMPLLCGRRAVEIQNRGPTSIFCALYIDSHARLGRAREVASGASWSIDVSDKAPIFCVASSAQAQGAATIFTEVR